MKKTIATTVALLSLALLAGCGGDDGAKGEDKPADTGSQAPANDEKSGEHGLGAPYEYPDGFTVTLSDFERGKSSDTALPADTDYIGFTVQVENKTGEPVDLALFTLMCKTGDEGADAEEVFDEGLGGELTGTVNDGKKATGDFACVMDPAETKLQVEISPNYGEDITELPDTAVFSGEVAAA